MTQTLIALGLFVCAGAFVWREPIHHFIIGVGFWFSDLEARADSKKLERAARDVEKAAHKAHAEPDFSHIGRAAE